MRSIIITIMLLAITGCSTVTRWEPTLNPVPDKNSQNQDKDVAECRVLANQAAGWIKDGLADSVTTSALLASEGAVLGAITGSFGAGIGAGVGAATGAIGGLWWGGYEADLTFKRAFSNCLWQRGHFPIN